MSNELKRYKPDLLIDRAFGFVNAEMAENDHGLYVLHSDALAAIEAAKPKWLPIETLPEDAGRVLIRGYGSTVVAGLNNGRWEIVNDCWIDPKDVTHWQPHPSPPPPESD